MTAQDKAGGSLANPAILIPFLLITLIWSSTWIVIKDQLGTVPAPWSVAYRFMLASGAMFAMALAGGASLRIGRGGHVLAAAIGLPQFVLNFNLVYAAEHHVTSGIVAVVFALLVVPNALLARAFFGQTVSRQFLAGSAVAMVGVALLFWAELRLSNAASGEVLVGIGFTLLAVLAASVGNLLQLVPTVKRLPVASLLAWAMFYGALVNGAIALVLHGGPVGEARIGYWLGLMWLGLAASAFAFFFYYRIIGDRPGQGGLFQRPGADRRHADLDVCRGLSMDRGGGGGRDPGAGRAGGGAERPSPGRAGADAGLMDAGPAKQ